jgi:protease I
VDAKEVKVLVIPGGLGCPDQLRRYPTCLKLISSVSEAGGVVGFICHGAWVAISAKIVRGKKATAHPAIKDDVENAGAIWSDEPSVIDGRLVSAQKPPDLPAFFQNIFKVLDGTQ